MTDARTPQQVADDTHNAYSFGLAYRAREWRQIAVFLDAEGYGPADIEEILRSKYMRWCGDHELTGRQRYVTLAQFAHYYRTTAKPGIRAMLRDWANRVAVPS